MRHPHASSPPAPRTPTPMELDLKGQEQLLRPALVILAIIALATCAIGAGMQYATAFDEHRAQLRDSVELCRKLVDAFAESNRAAGRTIAQTDQICRLLISRELDPGLGESREIIVGHREGAALRLLIPRLTGPPIERSLSADSDFAEPMRRAFAGNSGVMQTLDYREAPVLAAYAPLPQSDWALIVKTDLDALRAPYMRAGVFGTCVALLLAIVGGGWARRACRPLIQRVAEREARCRAVVDNAVENAESARAEAGAAAEAASRAALELLANTSHEIRTPLTAILGFAETLADPAMTEPARAETQRTLRRNGEHLLAILNDILDMAKIEAGRLDVHRTRFDPLTIVRDVRSMMQVRAQTKKLGLHVEYVDPIPATIESDAVRLKQVLINLLSNAIKFTTHGEVRMIVRYVPGDSSGVGARLQFEVTDTGRGMSADQLTRIFTPFAHADPAAARQLGGTGLGLTISRRLAQLLGGDIAVQSAPGKGSTFHAWVDVGSMDGVAMTQDAAQAVVALPEAVARVQPGVRLDGRKVLVAEDGIDNQRLITLILRNAGAEVMVAENGRVAVDLALAARARGTPYDAVLMDIQMPEMDGYEAVQALRQAAYAGPVIALTAYALAGDRERCLAAGCDEYVSKPVDAKRLLALLDAAIQRGDRFAVKVAAQT